MLGSYILLLIFLYGFIFNNYKIIFIIIIISAFNDLFKINIGFSIPIHFLIPLFYLPYTLKYVLKNYKILTQIFTPLFIEYFYLIILTFIFGFMFPWSSYYDFNRSWTQLAYGRSIIQLFKYFCEFNLLFFTLFLFKANKINFDFVVNIFSTFIIFIIVFTLFDVGLSINIKQFLFSNELVVFRRFTGLNGEPRNFGRNCSLILLFLIFFSNKSMIKNKIAIIFSIIGIIISLSASTYLVTTIWLAIYAASIRKIRIFIIPFLASLFLLIYLIQDIKNPNINETTKKINLVFGLMGDEELNEDKVHPNEPTILASFEVFDRAALNFFYFNKYYLLTGTGPNLISIPSSPYLNKKAYSIYGDNIDSVPHMFIVNLLSRSGIIGILFWFIFIFRYNKLKSKDLITNKYFNLIILFHFIVFNPILYLFIGITVTSKIKNLI
jgi:hypothetical protein